MLSKRSPPLIGKLTGSSLSNPSGSGGATSPRSPLELKIQSPRGLKSYNLDGVGLGIVAALEKAGNFRSEIQSNKAFFNNRNSNRSKPIPVNSANNYPRPQKSSKEMDMEMEMEIEMDDSEEDYTFVTYHRPENKSYTRVYCNGDEQTQININKTVFNRNMKSKSKTKSNHGIVYEISPARFNEYSAFPTSDFLSSCDLCHKNLHGKDIYMYRGEKAFCSTECRYRQIVMDERKEKCGSEASRSSVDVSTSPYRDQIFSTGILAI